jgi:hypothetical protein
MYRTLENNEFENFDVCKLDRLIAIAKLFAIMNCYGFSIQYLLNVLLNFHEIDLCHL